MNNNKKGFLPKFLITVSLFCASFVFAADDPVGLFKNALFYVAQNYVLGILIVLIAIGTAVGIWRGVIHPLWGAIVGFCVICAMIYFTDEGNIKNLMSKFKSSELKTKIESGN